jgi:hypothetical protein
MDSSAWARGIFTRPRRITVAAVRRSSTQEAIPGLPDHLVAACILRSEYFDDPADLARLPAVSRAMRDAVAATGLQFEDLDEEEAVNLGYLSVVQRLQRQGRLSRQEFICFAAAMSGQLEELKALRADGCPWDSNTCSSWRASRGAAVGARERLPVGREHLHIGGERRAPRGAAMGAREWVPVGRRYVRGGGGGRAPQGAAVGARK